MFDLRAKRAMNQGFGDTMTRAFELVVTPTLFILLGVWLDGRAGTGPYLAIGLGVFAVAGVFAKMWLTYEAAMRREHEQMVAARRRPTGPVGPAGEERA